MSFPVRRCTTYRLTVPVWLSVGIPLLPIALHLFVVLSLFLLPIGLSSVRAGILIDSAEARRLFVGHLNTDCYPDTLLGKPSTGGDYLPWKIMWGQPLPPLCPPPSLLPLTQTEFTYPVWIEAAAAASVRKVNPNDMLYDLVFHLWGKKHSLSPEPDTVRDLVLFGQDKLTRESMIVLANIPPGFQTTPFFAIDMEIGTHFASAGFRDVTGTISYEFLPVSFSLPPPQPQPIESGAGQTTDVAVYPNPAEHAASVQAQALPPGEYTITMQGMNGAVYQKRTVQVDGNKTLQTLLDVSELASGYYLVQVHSGTMGKSIKRGVISNS